MVYLMAWKQTDAPDDVQWKPVKETYIFNLDSIEYFNMWAEKCL